MAAAKPKVSGGGILARHGKGILREEPCVLLIMAGSEGAPPGVAPEPNISVWWHVGHVSMWVVTGPICYVTYKDEWPRQARHRLATSIWIGFAVWISLILLMVLLDAALRVLTVHAAGRHAHVSSPWQTV